MNENITIIDKNNNGIMAEGLSYFKFLQNGKSYVLYTLNEIVQNNLVKIYVGEVSDVAGSLDKVPDEEWEILRAAIQPVSMGQPMSGVEYMRMNDVTFTIGIPKKLAVTDMAKQVIRNSYVEAMATRNDTVSNEPAIGESIPFETEEISNEKKEDADLSLPNMNIFDTPMQPSVEAPITTEPPALETPTEASVNSNTSTVSKEEVMKALEVLNRYFKTEEPMNIEESAISLMDELGSDEKVENKHEIPAMETVIPEPIPSSIAPITPEEIEPAEPINADLIPNAQIIDMDALDDFETMETPKVEENTNYTANNNGAALSMESDTPNNLGSQVVLPSNYTNQPVSSTEPLFGPGSIPTE